LAEMTGRKFIDVDEMIVEMAQKPIPQIFAEEGERAFRDLESEVIAELAPRGGLIIATGGGAVLREENLHALRHNGKLVFLDRPLEDLTATSDRPLSSDRAALEQRYKERYHKYCAAADLQLWQPDGPTAVAEKIVEELSK
ncbi:MAG: shikimate kinase, partial [Clostridia bacterium]|nr:shikimate kinase [Clostridia bacterium]